MRVMVLVKATPESEAGTLPSTELLAAVGAYNQQLIDAGVLVSGEGLLPSVHGVRVTFTADGPRTTTGPFDATDALVSGFWIWRVESMDDALRWASLAPFPSGAALELRPIASADDFGDSLTDELREQEQAQRNRLDSGG